MNGEDINNKMRKHFAKRLAGVHVSACTKDDMILLLEMAISDMWTEIAVEWGYLEKSK